MSIMLQSHGETCPSAPASIRVLVVEAHPLMRAGIRAVLASKPNLELVGATDTSNAGLRVARAAQPDVVLLDIDTCDDGGMAATHMFAAEQSHPRVIALTILAEHDAIVQALRAGASGLISKDATEDDLVDALQAAASGEIYVQRRSLSMLAASVRRRLPSPQERAARAHFAALSERERSVLEYVANGWTGSEIGQRLRITAKTVDTYRHRIRQKIGLLHRADYIRFALLIGVLQK